jgi:hypothetical protein
MEDKAMNNQSFETNKVDKYSVDSLIKKIEKHTIRFDHPSQRESEQWSSKMKGNLISDILQGNPIPAIVLAEQIINGVSITWDLDGKQRCTNVYSYVKNGFKIPKGIRRGTIKYQTIQKEEDGSIKLDEKGIPVMTWAECNIIGKTFSQLPEELQDKIKDYCFEVVLYLNCSSEDIIYHIARYNDGKPMNKTQKGIINLGEEFAQEVKDIAGHSFFIDCGEYGRNGKTNGTIDRIICETIMASNYLENWKSNQEDVCEYIRENADVDVFDDVRDSLDRLEDLVDGSNEQLFTAKESFIWLTVFHRFKTMEYEGKSDDDFGRFMTKFVDELNELPVEGHTYKELEGRKSTKDKNLVVNKINYLERLLDDFIHGRIGAAA